MTARCFAPLLTALLTLLAVAVALHALRLLRRTSALPLLWALFTAVPLGVIGVFAVAGSPSTIKGKNGEGSLLPGAKVKLLGVWVLLNTPVQLLSAL
jgi:hypothetical protein